MPKPQLKPDIRLTAKEQRLLDYWISCDGEPRTIGETCDACRTTPRTLLGKTSPSLKAKLEQAMELGRLEIFEHSLIKKARSGLRQIYRRTDS